MRRASHQVKRCRLDTQAQSRRGTSDHIDPQDSNGAAKKSVVVHPDE
jgi:hypothetical protein